MSNSIRRSSQRPVLSLLGAVLLLLIAAAVAPPVNAAYYKMVACSGSNGAPPHSYGTNTRSSANPEGIFHAWNFCTGQGGDPPGDKSFFRLQEHKVGGEAGHNAYGHFVFDTPSGVHFKAAGGYTRQPDFFNDGWRARFWVASSCCTAQIVNIGKGLSNNGGEGAPTSTFAPHLWPLNVWYDFTRFVFEMKCVKSSGCSTNGVNSTDLNGLVFILSDDARPRVEFENTKADFLAGRWVKGTQKVDFESDDNESGMRAERVLIDGKEQWRHDHNCNTSASNANGEWAREYKPCPNNERDRHVSVNTSNFSDGSHSVKVCTQDFSQFQGLSGSRGETCTSSLTIRADNTAPAAPETLEATSANPERYLSRFGAKWALPSNAGSPIKKIHYDVIDADDKVVTPKQTASGTNPTALPEFEGPEERGPYRLRVWLEDEVGYVGPAASVPVPRDTTPPAAPQDLRIANASTARWAESFGLRWTNVVDAGSPINGAFYQIIDGLGDPVGAAQAARAVNVETINGVQSPERRGDYAVRVWLKDEEGNVGAAAKIPLPRDTEPPAAPQGVSVALPGASRAEEGFDIRWRNINDAGSPIDAAHYKVLNRDGQAVVPATRVEGGNIQAIAGLQAPQARGPYSLELWLSDEEGNIGAPVSVPISYTCVRSDSGPAGALSTAVAKGGRRRVVVRQGKSVRLRGRLVSAGGAGIAGAPLCIFSRVLTNVAPEFVGIALSGLDGQYRFRIPAGPSRDLTAAYRSGHRRLESEPARVATRVKPHFKVRKKVVRNKRFARFYGCLPGPQNENVVVVLQVKRGKGWLAFRRVRSQKNGCFFVPYRFNRVFAPTLFLMRAQVRQQRGYPYRQGTSGQLKLIVLPDRRTAR